MEEIFQNKLKRFSEASRKWKKTLQTKAQSILRLVAGKIGQWWGVFKSTPKKIKTRLTGAVFENHYGIQLVKTWVSAAGYIVVFTIGTLVVIALDQQEDTRRIIHNEGANEAVIGVASILLALLIPVAIALIEDAKGSPLARQTIVKSIIRFNFTPLVLLLICVFLFIPVGVVVSGPTATLRSLYAPIVVACIIFILMCFYRSYKWLSDSSLYSSGTPQTPSPDDPQPEAFFSYRFAQIVKLLYGAKSYETWIIIWSQWFPAEYEDVLHTAFFKRENAIIDKRNTKKYIILSLEVEAYDKYFDRRNKNSWRFTMDYTKQFLVLYAKVSNVLHENRVNARLEGLWRGEGALERINQKLISNSLNKSDAWELFQAMDQYLIEGDFIDIGDKNRPTSSRILNYFFEQYFEAVFDRDHDSYSMQHYFSEHTKWLATYDNLYTNRYNVSFVVVDEFKDWLFKKLDNAKEDWLLGIDSLFTNLFPETDPIAMGTLYWFLYLGQNSIESDHIIDTFTTSRRPIGHFGRSSTAEWIDDEKQRMKNFVAFQNEQENNSIKLFATMYATYFRGFWKLDELIETAKAKQGSNELDEKAKANLQTLVRMLEKIKTFYKSNEKKPLKRKKK